MHAASCLFFFYSVGCPVCKMILPATGTRPSNISQHNQDSTIMTTIHGHMQKSYFQLMLVSLKLTALIIKFVSAKAADKGMRETCTPI